MNAQPCLIWMNLFRHEWHANRPLRPDQLGTMMLSPIRLRCALCDRGMKGHAVEPKQTAIGTESSDNFKPSKHGHRFRGRLTFLDTELLLVRLPDLESGRKSVTSVRSFVRSSGATVPVSSPRDRSFCTIRPVRAHGIHGVHFRGGQKRKAILARAYRVSWRRRHKLRERASPGQHLFPRYVPYWLRSTGACRLARPLLKKLNSY